MRDAVSTSRKSIKKNVHVNEWNYKIMPYGYAQLSLMLNVIAMVGGILRYSVMSAIGY